MTLDDAHPAERVISHIRFLYPSVAIYAWARDFRAEEALLSSRVSHAVPETVEGSIQVGTAVLLGIGASDNDVAALLAAFRCVSASPGVF